MWNGDLLTSVRADVSSDVRGLSNRNICGYNRHELVHPVRSGQVPVDAGQYWRSGLPAVRQWHLLYSVRAVVGSNVRGMRHRQVLRSGGRIERSHLRGLQRRKVL